MHIQPESSNRFIALLLGIVVAAWTGLANADPPMRVARVGYVNGSVSFSPAGENDWIEATLNRPLVTGDRLWADSGARVELQIGTAAIRLGATTSVTLLNLDDRVAQFQLAQGTLDVRVRRLDRNQVLEIDTPDLAYVIRRPGQYRISVDPNGDATEVLTRSGQAEVYGEGASYVIDAGKYYRFVGTGLSNYEELALPGFDPFDRWAQERDRGYDNSISARYVSRDVIGSQDLDAYGTWRAVPEYGNVWIPTRVSSGWAPYRDGHWAWVDPWGWTWVDDAPWGFAVSHYGRWASVGGSWGWIPGPIAARAVYAPALVAFIGGSNFEVAISSGSVGAVGWFPLGPRDVYRPAYPVSRSYFTDVNVSNTVINNTNITNVYDNRNVTNVTYVNQQVPGAVVAVPTTAFVGSLPVARAELHVPREALVRATVTTVAAVVPMEVSVRGAAPQGRKPPAQVLERPVIVRSVPPAAPVAFAAKERVLAAHPGKPIDPSALAGLRPATPVAAPKVEVVAQTRNARPAAAPPPQAAPANARGKGEQPSQPQAIAPGAQPQPAPKAPTPVQPMQRAPASPPGAPGAQPPSSPHGPAIAQPPQRGPAPPPQAAMPAPSKPADKVDQRNLPEKSPVLARPPQANAPAFARPSQENAPTVARPPQENTRAVARPPQENAPAVARPPQPIASPVARPPQANMPAVARPPAPLEQRNKVEAHAPNTPTPVAAPPVPRALPQPQHARPEPPVVAKPVPKPGTPAAPVPVARPPESGHAGIPPPAGPPPKVEPRANKPGSVDKKGDKPLNGDEVVK